MGGDNQMGLSLEWPVSTLDTRLEVAVAAAHLTRGLEAKRTGEQRW